MSIGRLCGLAVIAVVIVPIILGMVWPTGTEEVDTWEVEPGIDITGDLSNRAVPIWDAYRGPLNNLSVWYPGTDLLTFPTPSEQTDVPGAYPVASVDSTTSAASVGISEMLGHSYSRVSIGTLAAMTITGDATEYHYADYWPGTNTLVFYGDSMEPAKTLTPDYSDVITAASGTLEITRFGAPTAYMDASKGLASAPAAWMWMNGMSNQSVDIWVRMLHTSVARFYVDLIQITWDGTSISVTDGTTSATLGSVYDYVSIRLNADGTAAVSGLIGVDSFLDRSYTVGNAIELRSSGHLDNIPMLGTYADWWVSSTVSAVGSTAGIKDSSFSPEAYFGVRSWQATIVNPSTSGNSLTIGQTVYPVSGGSITVTSLADGETTEQAVRGMRILSLIEDGQQAIYINGIPAIRANPSNVAITLDGEWLASVVIAKVTQSTATRMTWDIGSFGFDQTAFCMCGILACAGVAVAGGLWGRASGSTVLPLYVTLIICGIAYYTLI